MKKERTAQIYSSFSCSSFICPISTSSLFSSSLSSLKLFLGDLLRSIVKEKKRKKKIRKKLLGKRPRPPMKRTTSMTEITIDPNTTKAEAPPSDPHIPFNNYPKQAAAGLFGGDWGPQIQANGGGSAAAAVAGGGSGLEGLDQRLLATVSPRVNRRHSSYFLETPHFLRSCGLCRRRLVPGRDIYMYRGDTAFCSIECRQQQMNQDEKKKKCSIASKKQAATRSGVSAKGETVAAL